MLYSSTTLPFSSLSLLSDLLKIGKTKTECLCTMKLLRSNAKGIPSGE